MSPAAPTVWIVTPAWGRLAVSRLALAQRAHLSGELAARGITLRVVVVADDSNLALAEECGFDALEAPNELGRKVNDGIEYALERGAEYVTVVGSDDWVHASMFDRLPAATVRPPEPDDDNPVVVWKASGAAEAVCGRQIAVVSLHTGLLVHCVARGPAGVIPWVFPRRVFELAGGRPARDNVQKGLDGSMLATLGPHVEWVWHDPHPLARVDFKSGVNLNSWAAIVQAIGVGEEQAAWPHLAAAYPPELVELAQHTHDQLVGAPA